MVEKQIIMIDADLLDLAPVLVESLRKELKEIKLFTLKGDYEQVRERAHSSRGAALTFGFTVYAQELIKLREASLNKNIKIMSEINSRLEEMLEKVKFKAGY